MMTRTIVSTLAVILMLLSFAAHAAEVKVEGIEIFTMGTYVVSKQSTSGGAKAERTWKLATKSDQVTATIGTSFGIEYAIKGSPVGEPVDITLRYLHPTIRNPVTGKTFTSQQLTITTLVGKRVHEGFTFDHEWELVTGAWVIQVFHDGRKLGEQYFTVHKP